MAKHVQRGWFTEIVAGDTKLALVEKTSRTVDGVTDAWQAVREVIKLRIELSTSDTDLSSVTSSYNEINARYHRTIVNKAIATGYNLTKAVNPFATAIDVGLAGTDVIRGRKSVGDAMVGVGLSKFKKGRQLIKGVQTAQGVKYAKQHPLN